jgi:hypothetical protein
VVAAKSDKPPKNGMVGKAYKKWDVYHLPGLVNVNELERSTMLLMEKIHYKWQCSIAM